MNTLKLWIARDDKDNLNIYKGKKPKWVCPLSFLNEEGYWDGDYVMGLDNTDFHEVTWENSPQQVELKLCNTDFDRILEENKDVLERIKENGD